MLQFRAPSRDPASYVRTVFFAAMEKINVQSVSFALLRDVVITPSDATERHCHFCICVGVYAELAALLRIRVPLRDHNIYVLQCLLCFFEVNEDQDVCLFEYFVNS